MIACKTLVTWVRADSSPRSSSVEFSREGRAVRVKTMNGDLLDMQRDPYRICEHLSSVLNLANLEIPSIFCQTRKTCSA